MKYDFLIRKDENTVPKRSRRTVLKSLAIPGSGFPGKANHRSTNAAGADDR